MIIFPSDLHRSVDVISERKNEGQCQSVSIKNINLKGLYQLRQRPESKLQ